MSQLFNFLALHPEGVWRETSPAYETTEEVQPAPPMRVIGLVPQLIEGRLIFVRTFLVPGTAGG